MILERSCHVDRNCALSHSSLAAGNCDNLLDAEEVSLSIELLLLGFRRKDDINISNPLAFQLVLDQ